MPRLAAGPRRREGATPCPTLQRTDAPAAGVPRVEDFKVDSCPVLHDPVGARWPTHAPADMRACIPKRQRLAPAVRHRGHATAWLHCCCTRHVDPIAHLLLHSWMGSELSTICRSTQPSGVYCTPVVPWHRCAEASGTSPMALHVINTCPVGSILGRHAPTQRQPRASWRDAPLAVKYARASSDMTVVSRYRKPAGNGAGSHPPVPRTATVRISPPPLISARQGHVRILTQRSASADVRRRGSIPSRRTLMLLGSQGRPAAAEASGKRGAASITSGSTASKAALLGVSFTSSV